MITFKEYLSEACCKDELEESNGFIDDNDGTEYAVVFGKYIKYPGGREYCKKMGEKGTVITKQEYDTAYEMQKEAKKSTKAFEKICDKLMTANPKTVKGAVKAMKVLHDNDYESGKISGFQETDAQFGIGQWITYNGKSFKLSDERDNKYKFRSEDPKEIADEIVRIRRQRY